MRTKITALLLSLAALWVFAAWVTLREGVNLLWVQQMDERISKPGDVLVIKLQEERRLSMILAGDRTPENVKAVRDKRQETDAAVAEYTRLADSTMVRLAGDDILERRIEASFTALAGLEEARGWFDSPTQQYADHARSNYTDAVTAMFRVYDGMATLDDDQFANDTRVLVSINRARELFSQEDALVAGVLASGRFTTGSFNEFMQLVGAQRHAYAEVAQNLQESFPDAAERISSAPARIKTSGLEDQLIALVNPRKQIRAVTLAEWNSAAKTWFDETYDIMRDSGDGLVEDSIPIAAGVIIRLILAGGLGFLAVVASVVLSITTARHLVQQLERLKEAAHELADVRLPNVVERLGHGETVDVNAEAPPLEFGDDDIGKVGQAFNAVQETAIRTAVEQAELRRGIRDILLSLARRTQALVHRQLTLLDVMERREIDTEELEDLFKIDHLATRMRRNAENLIILSGATPARGWRRPVPMVDVVRSAVSEVEDYTRVTVMPIDEVHLVGRAVADIAHLLAELIENAVSFSPPYTYAQISGHMVASGYAIEVEDRGLGMSDENLELINQRIADPPEFNLSSSVQLGLYVVGKLAERYGIQVMLKRSPYKGTTAVVIIPRELIEEGESGAPSKPLTVVGASMPESTDSPSRNGELFSAPALVPPPAPEQAPPVNAPPAAEAPPQNPTTQSGLPVRVPQASLASQLREEPNEATVDDDPGRSPEEIRRIVGAFQSGTLRGRAASVESETE
ncbi:nitrate- and nitrite sensing domain-containing protein [Actinocorallia sp. A-T 12471]|uniref:sensor histidine kinase n=1 Tax=Actinocorallia sp. A-T 12471 TaxID=3089813 RepID=UPI0029D2D8B9|nr:nitrate- and nitrite sensing domain-containing protein [Actinocorallia sp. A-T 12471]MDX6743296.1 nitrate- and nitrite sensing domain-containing protein [Actinocorallia sp. A-T 12471]